MTTDNIDGTGPPTTERKLRDAATGACLGTATSHQVAMTWDGDRPLTGAVLIDARGKVVAPGSRASRHAGVRKVWVD